MIVKLKLNVPVKVFTDRDRENKAGKIIGADGFFLFVCNEVFLETEQGIQFPEGKYIHIEPLSFRREFENRFSSDYDLLHQMYVLSPSALLDFTVKFLEENGVKVALKEEEAQNG